MHDRLADEAADAAAALLDETGAALMSGDFDRFRPHFALPQGIATLDGARWLETEDDIRGIFREVVEHFRDIGVARIERTVDSALFDGPDRIHYSYTTRLLQADGGLARPAYPNLSTAGRRGMTWQVTGSQYSMRDGPAHRGALLAAGVVSTKAEELAALGQPAAAVFQHHLDAVTRAFLENDAALLERQTQLPFFMQKSKGTQVFTTPQDLRDDLKRYALEFKVHGVTDIVRLVKSVELVGKRRMHGTFRTHILRGTDLLIPAYVSAMTLEQGEDLQWRMTSLMHPMGHLTVRRVLLGEGD